MEAPTSPDYACTQVANICSRLGTHVALSVVFKSELLSVIDTRARDVHARTITKRVQIDCVLRLQNDNGHVLSLLFHCL